ncbi:MAG: DUF308 domain-containing protein [Spirochaetales bacterium]|nr:DUF308 domain-containing protein [Spirochaetales bacterium]
MKKWYLLSGILIFGLGLSFVIFPPFWSKVVVILLALGSIAYGIYNLVYTKKILENTIYEKTILIKSIASILIGFVALIFPLAIGNAVWTAMIIILIIYLIISALLGFYAAALLKNSGIERKRYFLENLVLLAIAVVLILISPEKLRNAIMRIIGIVLMVGGVGIAVYSFLMKDNIEKLESDTNDSEESAVKE